VKILSVGCGNREREPGVVRLDRVPGLDPDVVWNLNQYPYPFEDNTFDGIEAFDVIEHLEDLAEVFREFHRILQPGGWIKITTPHFSSANSYIDPTHRQHLSYFSLDYFTEEHRLAYYTPVRFELVHRTLHFAGGGWQQRILAPWANHHPSNYEHKWAWIFPAWFLSFELRAVKTT
jgi:SAM-dependent methyltransferase